MSRSPYHSLVTLPDYPVDPPGTILDFLDSRFPRVGRAEWLRRMTNGLVTDDSGVIIQPGSMYRHGIRLRYFREVPADIEPVIPFPGKIIFANRDITVALKPHFLPVIPSGPYVRECLLTWLRTSSGNPDIIPVNRLDRETTGLVLFSNRRETRDTYCELFRSGSVRREYEAVAEALAEPSPVNREIATRIEKGEPWFRSRITRGDINARTRITTIELPGRLGLFRLEALTGKQHQLRLHMNLAGYRILNDRLYPDLLEKQPPDFDSPLMLAARRLSFRDPLTMERFSFDAGPLLPWPVTATPGE